MSSPPSPGGATRYIKILVFSFPARPVQCWWVEIHTELTLTSFSFCVCVQVDNAYWLWTFQGRLLQKNNKDRFCQLLWRPRPPTLLSADQIKVPFYLYIYILLVCVCGASDDKFNFSDTSYESYSAAPDSNCDLRLTATTSCVLVQHILEIVFVILLVCGCGTFLYSKYPSASFRWSRRILRSTQRSLSRRIVWASPRPLRFDLFISLTDPFCSHLHLTFYLVEFVRNLTTISTLLVFSARSLTSWNSVDIQYN